MGRHAHRHISWKCQNNVMTLVWEMTTVLEIKCVVMMAAPMFVWIPYPQNQVRTVFFISYLTYSLYLIILYLLQKLNIVKCTFTSERFNWVSTIIQAPIPLTHVIGSKGLRNSRTNHVTASRVFPRLRKVFLVVFSSVVVGCWHKNTFLLEQIDRNILFNVRAKPFSPGFQRCYYKTEHHPLSDPLVPLYSER